MITHTKKRTNVSIDADLLELARKYNVKLSPLLEGAIKLHLKKLMAAEWLEENEDAFKNYNTTVERRGVFSEDMRTF